jgi:peptidoglycan/LPS O-acetylase OafA/YrhL
MHADAEVLVANAPSGLRQQVKELDYRPDIDGLRAVAVILVVAYHVGFSWARAGFVGVDIFFVISGYLIGSMVYRDVRAGRFSILGFYRRRAKRILPALFVVLVFSYFAATLLLSPHETRVFAAESIAALASSSNIFYSHLTSGYFSPDTKLNPLLMTWSLGVEEQFYLLFPLTMLLVRKRGWRTQLVFFALLAALSLAACGLGAARFPTYTFFLLPARAWELGAGVLLGIVEANRAPARRPAPAFLHHGLGIAGLVLLTMALVFINHSPASLGAPGLLPVAGVVLLIEARRGFANRLLALAPMRAIGLVSYSWYLWHWPLLSFARIVCRQEPGTTVAALIGLASFGIAALSFRFVEQPLRRSTTPAGPLLVRYAALTLAMMMPPLALFASQGLPQRNRSAALLDRTDANLGADKCMIQSPAMHPMLTAACGLTGTGPALALVGDSHGAALAGALREVAAQSGYRLFEFTKGFCTPAGSPLDKPEVGRECAVFNREAEDYIEKEPSIRAVFIVGYWRLLFLNPSECTDRRAGAQALRFHTTDQQLYALHSRQIADTLARLEASGKTVYLVEDNPHFSFDPVRVMRTELIEPRRLLAQALGDDAAPFHDGTAQECAFPGDAAARSLIQAAAASDSRARVVDLHWPFCSASSCRFEGDGETFFIDNNHLSLRGAEIALAGLHLPEEEEVRKQRGGF